MVGELQFTGERYMPEITGNIFLEHMHRYFLVARLVTGKAVLDIACGEGFGSNVLSGTAASVIGVDIAEEAVLHARSKYKSDRLSFKVGSVTAIPLLDASVDVVVSFETIEHISEHEEMLKEVKRVLRPGGMFVVSTPDKLTYTDATGQINPFHVKELYRGEFESLIASHFKHFRLHGQKIGFGSIIATEAGSAPFVETGSSSLATTDGLTDPMYLIAVASDDPENVSSMNGLFMQDIQSSEPVLKRVEFERDLWSNQVIGDIEWISKEVAALKEYSAIRKLPLGKLLHRIILSRFLYKLSKVKQFSPRRRRKFLNSAEKRDPFLLASRFDSFSANYSSRIAKNPIIAENSLRKAISSGIRVTAIVPNYNHASFLAQRLDSILGQTYPLIDVIVLDDCSTDDSRKVIEEYVVRHPDRMQAIYNMTNSGSVFAQWEKGHSLAQGDLVWICESDDFCEANFVERMISAFHDPSVMLAFGRIEFVNSEGSYVPGMEQYREQAEPGIWLNAFSRPAWSWFKGGFGVKNVIANVGGSMWRRVPIDPEVWNEARGYKIMGDWFMYSVLAQGGQIAYEPNAIAYFRSHSGNTSGQTAQSKPEYYAEYYRFMAALKRRWPLPDATIDRFIASCKSVSLAANVDDATFAKMLPAEEIKNIETDNVHVLIGLLGFSFGGGELFPIHLANALRRLGVMVSVLQMTDSDDHPDVRAMLEPSVPVYRADQVRENGGAAFISDAGISVIHSHIASVEMLMLQQLRVSTPYVATLHGSYEAMDLNTRTISAWADSVDQFVYTAERNLTAFKDLKTPKDKFIKFRNAMPIDPRPFAKTREQLGIPENAIVFTLVARGIEGKGWLEAVHAFKKLRQRRPDQPIALLAVGEGKLKDAAQLLAAGDPMIHFLGYENTIHGIYRISDIALVPTRFSGESYPLCLIQAMQAGIPAISTNVGEIKPMLQQNGHQAGLIVENLDDDETYIAALTDAMEMSLDPDRRTRLKSDAITVGKDYNIDVLAKEYLDLYRTVIERSDSIAAPKSKRNTA